MKAFDKDLTIPFNSNGMIRHACDDPNRYQCKKNFAFTDTLAFLKFCTGPENDHYALFQAKTSEKLYAMNDDDFQELLLNGTFNAKAHTVTGSFYFVQENKNLFSIVKAPPQNAQQEYQTHQKLMRETRPHALDMLTSAVGEHAENIWDSIASDVVKKLMEMRQPAHLNGWTRTTLQYAIGEQIMELIEQEE